MQEFSLKAIFKKYKLKISFTFLLLSLEALLLVLLPLGIGESINALLEKRYEGVYFLVALLVTLALITTARRLYDTRLYAKLYSLVSLKMLKQHKNVALSKTMMRCELIKELVDFFEQDLTQAFSSFIGILGALVMLLFYDVSLFLLCFGSAFCIYILYTLSTKKIFSHNMALNNELEKRLQLLQTKPLRFMVPHFRVLNHHMIKLSDIESFNALGVQFFISLSIVGSIFLGLHLGFNFGELFAILTYVLNFSLELFILPLLYQQFIRLKEISQRITQ